MWAKISKKKRVQGYVAFHCTKEHSASEMLVYY